jgi:hypothetical protein
MSSDGSVTTTLSPRARASRINGAKSRGPKSAAGKARSSQNALKHRTNPPARPARDAGSRPRGRPAGAASLLATTKRTRETAPNQHLDLRAPG